MTKKDNYHHTNLKQLLIQEGIRYINIYGIQDFSMRKLAGICNVSHMAPYKHFKNKNDFLIQILHYIDEEFASSLQNDNDIHLSADDYIIVIGKRYIDFMCQRPDIMRFIFTHGFQMFENKPRSYNIFIHAAKNFLFFYNVPESLHEQEIRFLWLIVIGISEMYTANILKQTDNFLLEVENILKHELEIRKHWFCSISKSNE